jgi:hypothetical protein
LRNIGFAFASSDHSIFGLSLIPGHEYTWDVVTLGREVMVCTSFYGRTTGICNNKLATIFSLIPGHEEYTWDAVTLGREVMVCTSLFMEERQAFATQQTGNNLLP